MGINSYIPGSSTQMLGVIIAICVGCLLFVSVFAFLIYLMIKRNAENKREMIRNDSTYSSMTDLEKEEFQKYCINPNEKPLAVIGNRGLKQYLVKDDEVEGFSVITNKRVYFKGAYLIRGENRKLITSNEDCTVDNYEIKKVEVITERPIWPLIVAGGAAIMEIAGIAFIFVSSYLGKI